MTLSSSIRAALTPKAFLPILGSISTGVLLMTMQTTSAQAAGQYYNCANANGCKLVDSKYFTSSYTKTQYPVVLAHGLGGFTTLFGVIDYFNGIPEDLMKGGSEVYTTKTSAVNNSEVRGEQLLQQVKTIAAISGELIWTQSGRYRYPLCRWRRAKVRGFSNRGIKPRTRVKNR